MQTINGTRAISISKNIDENIPMSSVPGIPNPYVGAFAWDYFMALVFAVNHFFPTWQAMRQALEKFSEMVFSTLLFSNTVALGRRKR